MTNIHLKIGEVKIGKEGDCFNINLKSDLGVIFIWRERNVCGLSHCLLPESPTGLNIISGRFISQAIPSLIEMMGIKEEDIPSIEVQIVGGSNDGINKTAERNIAAAKKYLEHYGFSSIKENVGGDYGRQVLVNCSEKTIQVSELNKVN